ncbi:Hypothetical_protein [Hexamita inflata]|uniref:Hypothetical_protein n=1 Tax=Hexamita inflata TaxID=28002 RepID=A0AA86UL52_9EUKA|nr:Hypothetical protein HINF_LOCUS31398 [Hexamita inflata]
MNCIMRQNRLMIQRQNEYLSSSIYRSKYAKQLMYSDFVNIREQLSSNPTQAVVSLYNLLSTSMIHFLPEDISLSLPLLYTKISRKYRPHLLALLIFTAETSGCSSILLVHLNLILESVRFSDHEETILCAKLFSVLADQTHTSNIVFQKLQFYQLEEYPPSQIEMMTKDSFLRESFQSDPVCFQLISAIEKMKIGGDEINYLLRFLNTNQLQKQNVNILKRECESQFQNLIEHDGFITLIMNFLSGKQRYLKELSLYVIKCALFDQNSIIYMQMLRELGLPQIIKKTLRINPEYEEILFEMLELGLWTNEFDIILDECSHELRTAVFG